ncbi:MAG: DegT/DnrJ/EryC1/StrS family aminotransferase [Butyrivibrio sp.]|nr:DegT/DnrJ/EryC1/StrS family aminotransferase [Butyrivibrio sp.]
MEFRDLKTQYLQHKDAIDSAIQNVLLRGQFIGGQPVEELEEKLADYVGVKHCITCANGTDTLQLALMAWGIGEGDAVFVPDFTFFSTAEVVPWVNAVPIFVDVDEDTFNLSAESLEIAVKNVLQEGKLMPKAVIAVDLFGQPADFPAIRKITDKYHLLLLEDAAQGFGGKIGEKRACSFGDIATTSFFPAKPLGCYGDGGAVFTNNDEWAELIRSYKVHGKGADKYDNVRIGMNSRLDTLQAAVLIEKLKFFDEELVRCNEIANEYYNRLRHEFHIPVILSGMTSAWAQYTICFENIEQRIKSINVLKERHIPTAIYYKKALHLQEAFNSIGVKEANCTVAVKLSEVCLSLPMHAYLDENDIALVSDALIGSLY